ncbi:hypothetical protein CRE_09723 [Caenorhabditis remanei]|uniref:Acyl-CoA thioesterase-like N-terminal HotDog domain-containing protein n=1 Tax=Caenorhabditis remanei TaxID=31234 RepID=E3N4Y4_CAERE|nr:hypothetical protein CRE_09723 [Caenorhabditis remanei]
MFLLFTTLKYTTDNVPTPPKGPPRPVIIVYSDGKIQFLKNTEDTAVNDFGGHVLAQRMSAVYSTASKGFTAHSVHCYFIRGGEKSIPITYNGKMIRDWRNFAIRYIKPVQHGNVVHLAVFPLQTLASLKETSSLTTELHQDPMVRSAISQGRHQKVDKGFDTR